MGQCARERLLVCCGHPEVRRIASDEPGHQGGNGVINREPEPRVDAARTRCSRDLLSSASDVCDPLLERFAVVVGRAGRAANVVVAQAVGRFVGLACELAKDHTSSATWSVASICGR